MDFVAANHKLIALFEPPKASQRNKTGKTAPDQQVAMLCVRIIGDINGVHGYSIGSLSRACHAFAAAQTEQRHLFQSSSTVNS